MPPAVAAGTLTTRILDATTDYAFGAAENILISVWRGSSTRASLKLQDVFLRSIAAAHPRNSACVGVIEPTSPRPTDEQREQMAQTLTALKDTLRGFAVIIEGSGLRPTAVRAIMTAVAIIKGNSQETCFFGDSATAQEWLTNLVKLPPGFNLTNHVEDVRAAMIR